MDRLHAGLIFTSFVVGCSSTANVPDPELGPALAVTDASAAPSAIDATASATDASAPTEDPDAPAALGPFDAAACAPNPPTGDYPADVGAVIAAKCAACHQNPPKSHAPFSLLTYEDAIQTLSPGVLRWQEMAYVIQPGANPHMPFGNAPPLAVAEKQTLDGWFAGCARPVPPGTGFAADASADGSLPEGASTTDDASADASTD
jgi:hypothetical protein